MTTSVSICTASLTLGALTLQDPASHTVHVASCAYNSLFMGELFVPDWDMFQSRHPMALYHAAARAVGGCAVYVSDHPGTRALQSPDRAALKLSCWCGSLGMSRPVRGLHAPVCSLRPGPPHGRDRCAPPVQASTTARCCASWCSPTAAYCARSSPGGPRWTASSRTPAATTRRRSRSGTSTQRPPSWAPSTARSVPAHRASCVERNDRSLFVEGGRRESVRGVQLAPGRSCSMLLAAVFPKLDVSGPSAVPA